MVTIQLKKLQFYSHHGVHEEETIVGTAFEIDVAVSFMETSLISTLDQTINYVAVYNIIKKHMEASSRLMETVIMLAAEDIYKLDNRIKTINITISKLNPPINNFTGNVGVIYHKEFL